MNFAQFAKMAKKINMSPEDIKLMLYKKLDQGVDESELKPKTKDKYLGLEIECFGNISAGRLHYLVYELDLEKYVQIGFDGSVDNPYSGYLDDEVSDDYGDDSLLVPDEGYELRVLIKERELSKVLKQLDVLFKRAKLKVDDSCGLHVHFDMRNRNYDACYEKLVKFQTAMYPLVDSSRHYNDYCNANEPGNPHHKNQKYRAINGGAYAQHKTIEVRLHHGTMDVKRIESWIKLVLCAINAPAVPEIKTKKDLLTWKHFNKSLKGYVDAHWKSLRTPLDMNEYVAPTFGTGMADVPW
jgi:hypothetical protein